MQWVQLYGDARKYNSAAKQTLRDQIAKKIYRDRAVISNVSQLGAADRAKVDAALKKAGGTATMQVSTNMTVTQGLFTGTWTNGIGGFATSDVYTSLVKQGAFYYLEKEKNSETTCAAFPAWGS